MNTQTNMINSNVDEMAQHGALYRKVKKYYNIASILYVALFLFYALAMFILGITLTGEEAIIIILDSLILKTGVIICGFMSSYKKNNVFAICAALIQVASVLICPKIGTFLDLLIGYAGTGLTFNALLLILAIVLTVLTLINNKKYKYLSEQAGFPHFNERRTNQEFDKKQREIKDEFQQKFDRLKKTSTDEMGDVSKLAPSDFMTKQYESSETEMDSI